MPRDGNIIDKAWLDVDFIRHDTTRALIRHAATWT
jgi:hypothetical protein